VDTEPRAAPADYPLMVATHVGLFTLPLLEVAWLRPRRPVLLLYAAAGTLAGATLLRWWSIRSLGAAWNVRAVVPSDLEPVERGPYRHIRHPNYVAVTLEMLALPLLGGAWRSAALLTLADSAILARRISAEESLLMQNADYRRRFADRPRFLPGLF
jgi:methyltransferase